MLRIPGHPSALVLARCTLRSVVLIHGYLATSSGWRPRAPAVRARPPGGSSGRTAGLAGGRRRSPRGTWATLGAEGRASRWPGRLNAAFLGRVGGRGSAEELISWDSAKTASAGDSGVIAWAHPRRRTRVTRQSGTILGSRAPPMPWPRIYLASGGCDLRQSGTRDCKYCARAAGRYPVQRAISTHPRKTSVGTVVSRASRRSSGWRRGPCCRSSASLVLPQSPRMGPSILHGPHHVAVKSTTTGCGAFRHPPRSCCR